MNLGILHAGQMGSALGAAAVHAGSDVFFISDQRSEATKARASAAGLIDLGDLDSLTKHCEIIFSVCPPANALEVAESVAACDFSGIYVDANAVSPDTARRIGEVVGVRADFVDGGIIGPPPRKPGSTRLYLSGERADVITPLFEDSPLHAEVVSGPAGAASALKMVYAAWTKGSAAMLAGIYAVATAEGVETALLAEWEKSIPDLPARLKGTAAGVAPKAWRFAGEMKEIAETFRSADVPEGFFDAAAEVYARLADFKDAPPPTPDDLARKLRAGR